LESKNDGSEDFNYRDSKDIMVIKKQLEDCNEKVETSEDERREIQKQLENCTREQGTVMKEYDRTIKEKDITIQNLTDQNKKLQKQLEVKNDGSRQKNQTVEIKSDCVEEKRNIKNLENILEQIREGLIKLINLDHTKIADDNNNQQKTIDILAILDSLENKYFNDLKHALTQTDNATKLLSQNIQKEYAVIIELLISAYTTIKNKYEAIGIRKIGDRDIEYVTNQITEKIKHLENYKINISYTEEIVKTLQSEWSKFNEYIASFETDVVKVRNKINGENKEIKKELQNCQSKNEELTELNQKLKDANNDMKSDLNKISETIERKTQPIQNKNKELQQTNATLQKENDDLTVKMQNLKEMNKSITEEKEKMSGEIESMRRNNNQLGATNTTLQKENNNLTKETEKLKEENKSILEEKAKMSAKMLEIIRNNNQLYDVHAKLYNEKRTNNSPSKAAPKENIIKLTPIPKSNNAKELTSLRSEKIKSPISRMLSIVFTLICRLVLLSRAKHFAMRLLLVTLYFVPVNLNRWKLSTLYILRLGSRHLTNY
jgi:chromosome segregation ATPase